VTPATTLADNESQFAPVGLVSVKIDITNQRVQTNNPKSEQVIGRRLNQATVKSSVVID